MISEVDRDGAPTWPVLSGEAMPVDAAEGVPGLIRRRYPADRDVVVCADESDSLTLHQLEVLSDILAERLRRVTDESGPVVLRLPRSVRRAVAALGVLKAGRAYLPIGLDEPAARVASMVRRARPVAVIGDGTALPELPVLAVPELTELPADGGEPAPLASVPPEQPVYVMFTSGSTGEPKGVVLGSAALCNRLLWMQRRFPLGPDDRVLQKTPYTFDPSGWEVFWPLIAAGRCEFAPEGAHRDPARLAGFMVRRGITVCHFVPSMLAEFLRTPQAGRITTLRHVFCSGEALPAPLARAALDRWPVRLHNLYGPTEAAIDVTWWEVPAGLRASDPVPIGLPVDNTVLAVVGDEGRPVPPGEPGELWIGGVQLALGYAGRLDLTAAAFPVAGGRRWYRTGDRVRRDEAGLHYLGRIDDQVKIGGVRAEPLEVERVLADRHPDVAVVAVPDPAGTVLVAALSGDAAVDDDELRAHAAAHLPAALRPVAYHRLAGFPLGTTGKLDRRRLAELVGAWWGHRDTPGTGGDELLSAWVSALNPGGPVDERAGFVAAGGSSLIAIRLIHAVREATGVQLSVGWFLEEDVSLARLREIVTASAGTAPAAPGPDTAAPRGTSPLAPEQRRLWLLGRLYPDSPAYNVTAVVRFAGAIDAAALRQALEATVRRHDILRASVGTDAAGAPFLRYETRPVVELAVDAAAEPLESVLDDYARRAATAVIGEERAPMMRAHLLRHATGAQAALVLVFNHLVADQETVDIVLADLATGYAAVLHGEQPPDTPAPSYAAYATAALAREGGERWDADLAYWRDRLAGAPPELRLPFRLPHPVQRDFAGDAQTLRLGAPFRERLGAYLRERNATAAGFFLAVFGTVLAAWSGQDTVVIGLPSAHRRSAAERGLAGFLVDTLPIRLDLDGVRTFDDLLRHTRGRYAEAMDHSTPPFDAVVSALPAPHRAQRDRVFQVWFNDLTGASPVPSFAEVSAEPVLAPVHGALFDLGLYLHRDGDGLAVQLVHALDAFPRAVAREILAQCARIAERILDEPGAALVDLDLVTDRAVLPQPDRALRPAGARTGLCDDLARVVAATPDAVAVASPRGELTYRQLGDRAGRAAAALTAAGVSSGDMVAVYATRDADLPVAVLAGWLAGAGVALIDATLPDGRRRAARDAVAARVTVGTGAEAAEGTRTVNDLVAAGLPPVPAVAAAGLSHVLFTSGTTGTPLAVAVAPGPLRDFLLWYTDTFRLGPADRFALLAGPGHDPVLREMFAAMLSGARLEVPPADVTADAGQLLDWLADRRITVLHATPALLELLVRVGRDVPHRARLDALRLVVTGGAPLAWGLVRRFRALSGAEIVNAYGTTETPQIASCHRITPGDDGAGLPDGAQVPVGAGVAGQQLLVLTGSGRLAAVGQRGEVVVRGRNLAAGYPGDGPADRFGTDPEPGVRTFRTGDLGRYGPDGSVWLDGRADRQVAIDGHRIELGEIEAGALRHPLVREALAAPAVRAIGPVLTLQVVTAGTLAEGELREFLRGLLPAYAVPVSVEVVDRLGVSRNGKPVPAEPAGPPPADSADPADPEEPAASSGAAATDAERALTAIEETIRGVLGRPIGPDENFFDAGLTSLALVQLHEVSTRELATALPVTAMFAYPNLRAMRRYLSGGEAAAPAVPVRSAGGAVRRVGNARRELRKRIRSESERP
ncbi:non-ribosomal peptide synthetase [Micromonospora sp. RTGN7]|uniref:non-ribosomal peptide synthetase n=1 Tax=Micromonospora sp. RTGN7 TaxID=3016526 RepID=UPI0029FEE653|nr:non-ribosomal peptide synthetase [Micromonospora sp. RTGN7]